MFTPYQIGSLAVPNKILRSPTGERMCDENGYITDQSIDFYRELAKGGCGLICLSHTYVLREGRAGDRQFGLDKDDTIEGHKRLVEEVHKYGAKIAVQITHAGVNGCAQHKGPTKVQETDEECFTVEEIHKIEEAFVAAAVRAKSAGYDMVVLHGAHGYLLSEFHSPVFNKRTDEYGGSFENRTRMTIEIANKIRSAVGSDFVLGIKLNTSDFAENGFTLEESTRLVVELYKLGFLFFESSGGINFKVVIRAGKEGSIPYHQNESKAWKLALNVEYEKSEKKLQKPIVACVGGIRTGTIANELLETGVCDVVSLSRPLISEPDLPNKWKKDPTITSRCVSCNGCILRRDVPFGCIYYREKEAREKQ